jgi:hypothetical protein
VDFGNVNLTISTTTLPTQTEVQFASANIPPIVPVVNISLQQTHGTYTGLSCSVTNVTRNGFVIVLDAVRTGEAGGSTEVILDRVSELTLPVSANWFAIA